MPIQASFQPSSPACVGQDSDGHACSSVISTIMSCFCRSPAGSRKPVAELQVTLSAVAHLALVVRRVLAVKHIPMAMYEAAAGF